MRQGWRECLRSFHVYTKIGRKQTSKKGRAMPCHSQFARIHPFRQKERARRVGTSRSLLLYRRMIHIHYYTCVILLGTSRAPRSAARHTVALVRALRGVNILASHGCLNLRFLYSTIVSAAGLRLRLVPTCIVLRLSPPPYSSRLSSRSNDSSMRSSFRRF